MRTLTVESERKKQKEEVLGVKVVRAHGECLGACGRRRTWQAAKSCGEVQATVDPQMSEWGNPAGCRAQSPRKRRSPGEVKHLSSRRRRNRRDALSSGERKGWSLNLLRVKPAGVARRGLRGQSGTCRSGIGKLQTFSVAERCWESRSKRVKAP